MAKVNERMELAALAAVVEAYGGDEARWPTAAAERLGPLIARKAEARRLIAEAKALDRLLAEAEAADERPSTRQAALADRIMLATGAAAGTVSGGNVVTIGSAREMAPRRRVAARESWQAAALLAASLVAGLYVGSGLGTSPLLADVAERLGIGQLVEPAGVLISEAAGTEREEEWL